MKSEKKTRVNFKVGFCFFFVFFPDLKEDYNSIKTLLDTLKYDEYSWEVFRDLILVAFLMGLQGGLTKFSCYLCLWDNRDAMAHYQRRDWPRWTEFTVWRNSVKWEPLVDLRKVLMPPLNVIHLINNLLQL